MLFNNKKNHPHSNVLLIFMLEYTILLIVDP